MATVNFAVKCRYDDLKPVRELKTLQHPENPNDHSQAQIQRLAEIMAYQGIRHPIVISKNSGRITKGHGRLLSAEFNQWNSFPVEYQDYEDEDQEYADVVSDNAIALWAELDLAKINAKLPELGPDLNIELLGIKDFVLEPADKYADKDADEIPETRKTDIKLGDLFQLGSHRLLCGDATSKEDIERLMNGEKADMVFTSPPYNLGHNQMKNSQSPQKKYKSWEADQKSEEDYLALLTRFLETARNVSGYQFVNLQMLEPNKRALLDWLYDQKLYFADVLIWDKRHGPIASRNQFNSQFEFIFVFGPNKGQNRGINLRPFGNFPNLFQLPASGQIEENTFDHRAMFPVALPEKFISELLEPGGIVLEPFCGSGSTLIACEKTNRKCFGMEIDPQYCQVIIDRYEKFTSQKAVKL